MLILHVIVGLKVGGAELMLKRLVEAHQNNEKYKHVVFSLTELGEIGRQLQSNGIDVYALGLTSAFGFPKVLWKLIRKIKKLQPNIVQTWMYHGDLLGGVAARLSGNRNVIWGIRTTDVTADGSRAAVIVRKLCIRLSYFVPHTIICAANASKDAHIRLGYRPDNMVVIPNGFSLSFSEASEELKRSFRNELGFSDTQIVIGCVGRFNADKDQNNFVQAAAKIASQFPHVQFLMVGRDCDKSNVQLLRWIDETGFPDRFTLLGERSDVHLCLSSMDVFCLSSKTEGFPNVVGEAMAMSKPCVVTNVGDAAFLLGDCGVVVPKQDSQALANGMMRLIELSQSERAALGMRAYQRIASKFTMECSRKKFEEVYAKVTASDC